MLKNEPTLAIVAVDTEENERLKFGVNYSVYSFHFLITSRVQRTLPERFLFRMCTKKKLRIKMVLKE